MKGLILFLFFLSTTLTYQNCSESPKDFIGTSLNATCTPEDKCLKYSLQIDASVDKKVSRVCLDTKNTDNGTTTDPKFSVGCSTLNAACSYCNLSNPHKVGFAVTAKDSKAGVAQTIEINFTPDGNAQTQSN